MKKHLAIVALLCVFQINSFSQRAWKVLNVSVDTTRHTVTTMYIDSVYFSSDKIGHIEVWGRLKFDDPLNRSRFKSALTDFLYTVDCNRRRIVEMEEIRRNPSDETIIEDIKLDPPYNNWVKEIPNSISEIFIETACKLFVPKQ